MDFGFLDSRPQMFQVFFEYFRLLGDSVLAITKVQSLIDLRTFVGFLDEYEKKNAVSYNTTFDLDAGILLNFKIWLEIRPSQSNHPIAKKGTKRVSIKRAAGIYNSVVCILNRLRVYRPQWFPSLPSILAKSRSNPASVNPAKDVLSVRDLKKIVRVASVEINRVVKRHAKVQRLLEESLHFPVVSLDRKRGPKYWHEKRNVVHSVIREQDLNGPVKAKLKHALNNHGTSMTEVLSGYVPVGERALIPFALQLLFQTGLNVSSLATLTRDCVEDFLLPQYKRLVYDKARSQTRRMKSQLIPYSKSTAQVANSGPFEVIEFLKRWTQPLADIAPSQLNNYLFLFRPVAGDPKGKRDRVKVVSKYDAFLYPFSQFLSDHPELPKFTLRDLRPAVATYLYLTTHDVSRVKRFLGHAQIATTLSYIRGRIVATEQDLAMAAGIEKMVSRLAPKKPSSSNSNQRALPVLATVIGSGNSELRADGECAELTKADLETIRQSGVMTLVARCRNPDQPPSFLKVPPGRRCTFIFKCLNCPNAIVLEEDLPLVLLRLKQIWAERKRLTPEGWQITYGEVWAALNQVIRLFPAEVRERAADITNAESRVEE